MTDYIQTAYDLCVGCSEQSEYVRGIAEFMLNTGIIKNVGKETLIHHITTPKVREMGEVWYVVRSKDKVYRLYRSENAAKTVFQRYADDPEYADWGVYLYVVIAAVGTSADVVAAEAFRYEATPNLLKVREERS